MQMLPPGRQAKTGTGGVRGRVVAIDTGTAVRRAQVRISGPDIGTKTALTDAQGRYEFRDLPAGRFNVSVSKSGFVTMQLRAEPAVRAGTADRAGRRAEDGQGRRRAAARQRARRPRRRRVRRGGGRSRSHRDAHAVHERPAPAGAVGPQRHDQRSRAVPDLRPAAGRVLRERDAPQHEHDDDGHARRRRRAGRPDPTRTPDTRRPTIRRRRRPARRSAWRSRSARSSPASTSSSSP